MDKQFLQKHSVGDNLIGDGRIVVIPAKGNDFGHLVLTDTGTSRAWISHQQPPITHPHWPTYTPLLPGTDAKLNDGYGRLTSVPQVAVYDPRTQKWSSIYTEFGENRNYRTTTERCHTCIPHVIKNRQDGDMPYGVSWTRDQVRMLNESQYLNMQRGAKVGPGLIATTQSGTSLYTDGTGLSEMLMMICDRGSMDGFWTLWCGGSGVYVWDVEERQLIQPIPGTGSPSMPKMGRENHKPYYRVVETKNDGTYEVPIDLVVYFATHHAYVQKKKKRRSVQVETDLTIPTVSNYTLIPTRKPSPPFAFRPHPRRTGSDFGIGASGAAAQQRPPDKNKKAAAMHRADVQNSGKYGGVQVRAQATTPRPRTYVESTATRQQAKAGSDGEHSILTSSGPPVTSFMDYSDRVTFNLSPNPNYISGNDMIRTPSPESSPRHSPVPESTGQQRHSSRYFSGSTTEILTPNRPREPTRRRRSDQI